MWPAPGDGRSHDEFSRLSLRVVDKFFHCLRRERIRHEHEKRKLRDQGDRRQVGYRTIIERAVQSAIRGERRGAIQQCVTISIGVRDECITYVGTGATFVVNDDLLNPEL